MHTIDIIRDENVNPAQMHQMLDEISKAGDLSFDLQGAVNIIGAMIEALPLGHINGALLLKVRACSLTAELHSAIADIYSNAMSEITSLQMQLDLIEGRGVYDD